MGKLQALTALRDKVKAGTCVIPDDVHESPLPFSVEMYTVDAYNGSLDAAKALHEAVLPGWGYEICNGAEVTLRQYSKKIIFKNVCPARAWLLAILEALIAQEGTDHE